MVRLFVNEGLDVGGIGRQLGRDYRTVRRHLRVLGVLEQPANDLPGLWPHWEQLLEVIHELQGVQVFPLSSHDLLPWWLDTERQNWPMAKGRVSRGKDGRILVHLDVEETLEWEHLREHLSSDQLLDILAGWKVAMAEDVEARSALFQLLMEKAESETGLPVEKGLADVDNKHPYLHAYLVAALYDQITSTAIGRPRAPLRREQFVKEPGRVYLRHFLVIGEAAGEQVQKAIRFLLEAQRSYGNSDHAKAMSAAYEVANARTVELKRRTRRIELAVEVPGKCQQCGPMSGAPVKLRRGT